MSPTGDTLRETFFVAGLQTWTFWSSVPTATSSPAQPNRTAVEFEV